MNDNIELTSGQEGYIEYKSANPFEFYHILNELDKVLNIKNAKVVNTKGLLKDKSFLVTGKLNNISRAEVKSLIEENSGTTVSSVSKKLNYLITGEKPTKKKIESAKALKIKIIDQDEFLKMLNKTS